jgi:Ca2+/H+ antiporter
MESTLILRGVTKEAEKLGPGLSSPQIDAIFATAGAAFAVRLITADGETTWFEGLLLIGIHLLFALAYYFESPA